MKGLRILARKQRISDDYIKAFANIPAANVLDAGSSPA
jgi:hypothetical protein